MRFKETYASAGATLSTRTGAGAGAEMIIGAGAGAGTIIGAGAGSLIASSLNEVGPSIF